MPEEKTWEQKIRDNDPETGITHITFGEYVVDEEKLIEFIKKVANNYF